MWHSSPREVFTDVFRPLIRFGKKEPALIVGVDRSAQLLDDLVRLAKILVIGASRSTR